MNKIQSDKGVHEGYDEIGKKIWNGEYFGPDGAVALAHKAYIGSFSLRNSEKERANLALMYACTLYSTIGNCVAQVKKFRLEFLLVGAEIFWCLRGVIARIVQEKIHENFDASQKEVLIAYLLICKVVSPFSGYRNLAIKLGENVISEDNCSHATYLLTMARLSRLWFYPKAEEYREYVLSNLRIAKRQVESGWIDWRTVNRLARLIGDEEIKNYSAPLADSKDVMVKSGM